MSDEDERPASTASEIRRSSGVLPKVALECKRKGSAARPTQAWCGAGGCALPAASRRSCVAARDGNVKKRRRRSEQVHLHALCAERMERSASLVR